MKTFTVRERDGVIKEIQRIHNDATMVNMNDVIFIRKDIFGIINVYYSMFSDYAEAEQYVKDHDEKFEKIGMPYVIYLNNAMQYTNEQSFDWED